MQFWRAECILSDGDNEWLKTESESRHSRYMLNREISTRTDNFESNWSDTLFVFTAEFSPTHYAAGLISTETIDSELLFKRYLQDIGVQFSSIDCKEVMYGQFREMLDIADRNGYIENADDIYKIFNLESLNNHDFPDIDIFENMIRDCTKESAYKAAGRCLANETFIPELDRIYEGCKRTDVIGHPVHYILETDDPTLRKNMTRTLLEALYANNRLENRRYTILDFEPRCRTSESGIKYLYRTCQGGAVLIDLTAINDEESDQATPNIRLVEAISRAMLHFRRDVLTIICLPSKSGKQRERLYENAGNMVFIELREDFVRGEEARTYLKDMARASHVRPDRWLLDKVEDNEGYLTSSLKDTFDQWYCEKLATKIYPQYKAAASVKHLIKEASPKSNAYDDLMEMVGLKEAKKVINEALDFFKAQKVFADAGMAKDRPAMHMVFTGNPGTAKTSVARLFAHILYDNGILSSGHIVEVGRGDLVGKYVGWTAQTVQKKFAEASGGVLFIDEAYSLVDDRDGSYGDEAINTIVQEMENHRKDVVVIFAGYPDKMEGFLKKNPGLRSRIAFHVPFEDYGVDELVKISQLIAKRDGLSISDDASRKMKGIFEMACRSTDFGNGRYARNLIEKARMKQASRLIRQDLSVVTKRDLQRLEESDIEFPAEMKETVKSSRMGFCM